MSVPNKDQMEQLERLLDQCGLFDTLIALSVICGDKAAHVQANWQDGRLARRWTTASNRVQAVAEQYAQADLP